jgi:hypothetical protein
VYNISRFILLPLGDSYKMKLQADIVVALFTDLKLFSDAGSKNLKE